jgi:hypothetical protein
VQSEGSEGMTFSVIQIVCIFVLGWVLGMVMCAMIGTIAIRKLKKGIKG